MSKCVELSKFDQLERPVVPDWVWLGVLKLVLALVVLCNVDTAAHAAGTAGIDAMFESVVKWLTGPMARSIGIICLCIIGYGCWAGDFHMRTLGTFIGGSILVFGGAEVMDFFSKA
jgi:type IV secretory pathway VirB2 component (pilin)